MSEFKSYTPEEVAKILEEEQMPLYRDFYHPAGISFSMVKDYLTLRPPANDFTINLPDSELVYYGPMYWQRGEPTCLPWSYVNTMCTLGQKPNPEHLAEMLNRCLREDHPTIQEVNGKLGVLRSGTLPLKPLQEESSQQKYIGILNKLTATIALTAFNSGHSLITYLSNSYYSRESEDLHAVCIAGYKISNGFMELQILDSNIGNFWAPIGLISENCKGYTAIGSSANERGVNYYTEPIPPSHITVGLPAEALLTNRDCIIWKSEMLPPYLSPTENT